jgi:hypothetical protein
MQPWAVAAMDGFEALVLCEDAERPVRVRGPEDTDVPVLLRQKGAPDGSTWMLLAPPEAGVHVNGLPLELGLRVLRDKDEIRLGERQRFFFSAEQVVQVVPFPGADQEVCCARCLDPIAPGATAVQCPNPACGAWHHQMPEKNLPCWSYTPTCALCDQPTALDAGFRWTPEEL